ncbi:hypothetical protein CCMSSC00406_0003727 [Pleurotus cornucopiae]|uniref:Uncharacterized protein n=1 Tax=Pleurotus cornucopiae TaxID=5321 RepID=A0ACB7IQW0_PLECO|nr:hypothetical protein CCMSSC00406_0003727 [Pleurotus cornucopiae]
MVARIYTSPYPPIPVASESLFTHLFSVTGPNEIGGYPAAHPAFIDAATGATVSRALLKHLALSLGYALRNHPQLKLKRGDTVMIFSPNSLAFPIALFGAIAGGLRCTLANSAYTSRELEHQYKDSGAKVILVAEDGVPVAREMLKDLGLTKDEVDQRIVVLGNGLQWAGNRSTKTTADPGLLTLDELLTLGTLPSEERFDGADTHETVLLCYSSGTTGKPKGVMTSHQNITSVLDMVKLVFPPLDPGKDVMLGVLPFYHIYGAVKLLNFPLAAGIPVVIQTKFDPVAFCENIARYRVTASLIVPPILVVLSRHPAVEKNDLSTLKILFSGAAPLGAALVKEVKRRLLACNGGKQECFVTQGYGLTETSPTTHLLSTADSDSKVGSIGLLLPNLEARLVVDGEGDGLIDAEEGQPGELWLRGPSIMKGYLNNDVATKDCITHDKWFKTGDIGIRDKEGYYYIVDRRKELIKYKVRPVFLSRQACLSLPARCRSNRCRAVPPAELESVLLTHPDIADAAVIGVYDEGEATEYPRAYVVPASPGKVTTPEQKRAFGGDVANWIKTKVAQHKFLRGGVIVIDVIPKSAAGKILRRELRELAKVEMENQPRKAKL